MKIGLVRHFKVDKKYPSKLVVSNKAVLQWFEEYEQADVVENHVDLCGVKWETCYSSPLQRAYKTASTIYNGKVVMADELRELEVHPFMQTNLYLPFLVWGMVIRIKVGGRNAH